MNSTAKSDNTDWEQDLSQLLEDLTSIQDEILQSLQTKRQLIMDQDLVALEAHQAHEEQLGQKLAECHERRSQMLLSAQQEGLPSSNLESLSKHIGRDKSESLPKRVKDASQRMRLIQHSSLTNWVVTQRTLLHLSQLLEFIGTNGRLKATYGESNADTSGGALIDREI